MYWEKVGLDQRLVLKRSDQGESYISKIVTYDYNNIIV